MVRELPLQLNVNNDYEITEPLTLDGVERILLSPSKCYLNDDIVQLEDVIHEIVRRYNFAFKLYQLHHQNKQDYTTEFIAQNSICCHKHMDEWWKQVAEEHPLPDGRQWLVCDEDSQYFVKCASPE